MEQIDREYDSQRFKQAIQAGARQVIAHKQELNQINVFPVSDGDTGSNLASLMQTILAETSEELPTTLGVFERVADASLVGARGNSGIIMAQYFNGLYANLVTQKEIGNISGFVRSAKLAVVDAYQAIDKPVEGTMITVIRSWAESLENQDQEGTIEYRLSQALIVAKVALEKTTEQLKILKKNQVVDSGAKGFYLFVEGFTHSFNQSEQSLVNEKQNQLKIHHQEPLFGEKPDHRYCTEILLDQVTETKEGLLQVLKKDGDSLVVAVNRGKARIHIHSNQPGEVLAKLRRFGQPIQQKVDDMLLQYQLKQKKIGKIALVTDSIADIPSDYLLDQQIHVLPMTILFNDGNYLDRLTIDNQAFFKLQQQSKEHGSSSQPSLSQIENLLTFLETHYEEIIIVTVSQKLSGTFQSVKRVAQKHAQSTKIAVIDSQQNSASQGLLVMRINQWIVEGKTFSEIVTKAETWRNQVKILVSVDDLEPMIHSGRIPRSLGKLAKKVGLKPLVSLADGEGKLSNFSLSLVGNQSKMFKVILDYQKKGQLLSYGIVYASNADRAIAWQVELTEALGLAPLFVLPISTVVALSAGDGSVAIAFELKEGVNS